MQASGLIRAAGIVLALQGLGPAFAVSADDAAVRTAALKIYIHGVTDTLAASQVGPESVPALVALLRDPEFPRRDNVVAFLAHLPAATAVPALLETLERPVGDLRRPSEDRAMLLAPHALGLIASRGSDQALDALLAMTAPGARGGPLARAMSRGRYDRRMRDDLVRAAVRALGTSGRKEARVRLDALATSRAEPIVEGLDLASEARESLAHGGDGLEAAPIVSPATPDPSARAHETTITYAQHASIAGTPGLTFSDAEVDLLLRRGNGLAAVPNIPADFACCHRLARGGSGLIFGAPGDGKDTLDGMTEFQQVVNNSVARVKIVRMINWCGGPVTNAIGCSILTGNGMVLVKLDDGFDPVLWLHEYGHNAGLTHDQDSRYVMYPELIGLGGYNAALRGSQCAALHAPPSATGATVADVGGCTDVDGDGIVITGDNCPLVSNLDQDDADGDFSGDVCDNCRYWSNHDQADVDGDTWGDLCDRCPGVADDQQDGDADGLGDACDPCPISASNDDDLDGLCGNVDNCAFTPNPVQEDTDGDFSGDLCDPCVLDPFNEDPDGDDICSAEDLCPSAWGPTVPDWSLPIVQSDVDAIGAGDVDADGFDDVLIAFPLVSAPGPPAPVSGAGELRLFRGSASGLSAQPSWVKLGTASAPGLGTKVASAGDVDSDGHADVIITSRLPSSSPGRRVSIHRGGPAGLIAEPWWSVVSTDEHRTFGDSLDAGSDIDGDGYLDVIIGDPGAERVWVYLGGADGLPTTPQVELRPSDAVPGRFGFAVAVPGDLDGDGWQDITVGSPYRSIVGFASSEGRVQVFFGPFLHSSPSAGWTIDGEDHLENLGYTLARVGDLDADGLPDLAAGAPQHSPRGAVAVHPGDEARHVLPARHLIPRDMWSIGASSFGTSIASLGDVQNDGYDDVAVGGGPMQLYSGSSTGIVWGASWSGGVWGAVRRAGDVDGDGFADLLTITQFGVGVFYGGPQGFAANRHRDSDGDGTPDECDPDADDDGVSNGLDHCRVAFDPEQTNSDGDSFGDACDNCPLVTSDDQSDGDQDGLGSPCDVCPHVFDPQQADLDGDEIGDVCDLDLDGDGVQNAADSCMLIPNASQSDRDGDGIGDPCDDCSDADGDGFGSDPAEVCAASIDCNDADPSKYPGAFDACDGEDNDCNLAADDAICSDFIPDGYERIDGHTLAAIGRAFGQCTSDPSSVSWGSVDFTHDRCIDGDDLAVLSVLWGCSGDVPICP